MPLPRRPGVDLLQGARPAARRRPRRRRACSTGPAPTSSSASAATSRCRPTSPPAAAGCRSCSTSRTPCPAWPTRPAPASPAGSPSASPTPRCPGPSTSACRSARMISRPRPRRAARRGPRASSASTPTGRRCWSPAARRARGGSTRRCPARPPRWPARACRCCTSSARRARRRPRRARCPYVVVPFVDRMDLAYAAADLVLSRVAAPTASSRPPRSGCPAVFVPLPIGNGEQEHNARPVVDAGGALLVHDADLTSAWVAATCRRWRPTRHGWRRWARPPPAWSRATPTSGWPASSSRSAEPVREGHGEDPRPRRAAARRGARPGALRRHRRRRPLGHRPDHGGPRAARHRQRRPRHPVPARRCASSASPATSATPPSTSRDADTRRRHHGRARGQPRGARGPAPRAPAAAAVGRAVVGDGRPPRRRGGRHPRQDHHDLAAHLRPGRGRRRPDVRRRRRARRHRPQRRRRRAATCSSPRPTRATAPSSSTARTPRSSPTSRPTTSTSGGPRRPTAQAFDGLRRDRRPRRLPGLLRRRPGRPRAGRPRPRARASGSSRVGEAADADVRATDLAFDGATSRFTAVPRRRGPGHGRRCGSPAATTSSTRSPPWSPGSSSGIPFDGLRDGLEAFAGSGRRMEAKGEAGGVRVYDSYAHHPAEIAADLEAARAVAGEGRLVVAFQPHLVSRTREFGAGHGRRAGRRRRGRRPRRLPRPRDAGPVP